MKLTISHSNLHVEITVLDQTAHMVQDHLQALAMEDNREQMPVVQILSEIHWEIRRKRDILMPICFLIITTELDQSISYEVSCGKPANAGHIFTFIQMTYGSFFRFLFKMAIGKRKGNLSTLQMPHTLLLILVTKRTSAVFQPTGHAFSGIISLSTFRSLLVPTYPGVFNSVYQQQNNSYGLCLPWWHAIYFTSLLITLLHVCISSQEGRRIGEIRQEKFLLFRKSFVCLHVQILDRIRGTSCSDLMSIFPFRRRSLFSTASRHSIYTIYTGTKLQVAGTCGWACILFPSHNYSGVSGFVL